MFFKNGRNDDFDLKKKKPSISRYRQKTPSPVFKRRQKTLHDLSVDFENFSVSVQDYILGNQIF